MSQDEASTVHRFCTLAQLSDLLQVPRERIRGWVKAGLVQPTETAPGEWQFDFRQMTGVKTLWKLTQAGVKTSRLRRCLEQLRAWFPDVQEPLAELGLLEENGQVLIRLDEGQLAEPSGQQHFDFEKDPPPPPGERRGLPPPNFPRRDKLGSAAEPWRQRGHYFENSGDLESAALAYRQALLDEGPDADTCFNLGNVLYRLGHKEQAIERFRQAVELDGGFAEAWNNLGNVLAEMDQLAEAVQAYRRAIAVKPLYADTHYNLADTLDQMGCEGEALDCLRSYLRLEPEGEWADYARRRIAATTA
jgi:tetratricopeptide (TPR) repeat protein